MCVALKDIRGSALCIQEMGACIKPRKDLNYNAESSGHVLQQSTKGDPARVLANHSQTTNHQDHNCWM